MASACNRNRSPSSGSAVGFHVAAEGGLQGVLVAGIHREPFVPAGVQGVGGRDGGSAAWQTLGQSDGIKGPQTAWTIGLGGGGVFGQMHRTRGFKRPATGDQLHRCAGQRGHAIGSAIEP